jgi:tRNA threonylcarbamoyladenosine biosynthesis protein TsaE
MPLFHFDMYRLHSSDDLWDIGWEDYLERMGVCAVEWSENITDALEDPLFICIEKLGENSRKITLKGGNIHALSL